MTTTRGARSLCMLMVIALALGAVSAEVRGVGIASTEPPRGEDTLPLLLHDSFEVAGWTVETWGTDPGRGVPDAALRVTRDGIVAFEWRDAFVRVVTQDGREDGHAVVTPGDDLTRDGVPNLLLEGFSGADACCYTIALLGVGADLEVVWHASLGRDSVAVVDLRSDGQRQLLGADPSFAGVFCGPDESPAPPFVLALEATAPRLVSLEFPTVFEDVGFAAMERLSLVPDDVDAATYQCVLAEFVLSLLYGGHEAAAEAMLLRFDRAGDPASFRDALWTIAQGSPFFQEP